MVVTPAMVVRCGALAVVSLGKLASSHFSHFEDARALWTYVLEHNPEAWIAWYNLGNTCADEGDPQGAIAAYERALQLRNFYPARFNLANPLAKSGRLPQAERAYLLAGRLNNDDAELHNNHGVVLLRLGRTDDAIAAFKRALELQPDSASAHTNLAVIFLRRGDVESAARHFEPAVQSGDTNCRRVSLTIADALQSGVASREKLLQLAARACAAAGSSHSEMASAIHSAGGAH
jgi:Flp pilus assembly protein TadD